MLKLLIMLLKQISKKAFIHFILPVVVIIASFYYSKILGIAFVIVYIGYLLYMNRVGIYSILGSISYGKGQMDKAIKWFGQAYQSQKAHPKMAVSYAYLLLKNGDIQEPEKILTDLLGKKIDKDSEMIAKSNLALVLWKKGQLDEAIAMLEKVHGEFKTSTIYGSLGYLLIAKGDLDRALEYNLEAYHYNDSNTIILDNLGQTYYLRGEYDKAEEIYHKLMASNPSFPEAYYNYGLLLLAKNEKEQALANMEKALNYQFTYLSTVTREEVETKIGEMKQAIQT